VWWSFTSTSTLVGGSPGSSPAQWKSVFENGTGYRFDHGKLEPTRMPTDNGWNWSDLRSKVGIFIYDIQDSFRLQNNSPSYYCYLFGISTPAGTPGQVIGRTFAQYDLQRGNGSAVSLVFKSRIDTISALTSEEQRWRAIQLTLLHELGHARGLNTGSDGNGDHDRHGGTNMGWCIMNILNIPMPSDNVICDYHKQVLKMCLPKIKEVYNVNDPCTQWQ
jgi:hypothetical protein